MKMAIAHTNDVNRSIEIDHLWIRRALLLCGIFASLTWLGTDIVASLRYAGYHYPFDAISGLSAFESPVRSLALLGGTLYTVLKLAFALGVWIYAGQDRALRITAVLLFAFGVTDLAASLFPWYPAEPLTTPANVMHSVLAGGLPVLWILLAIGFGAAADGRWFRLYSYGTLLGMLALGTLPLLGGLQISADQPPEWFGASERINAYGYMLWMMLLAIILLRSPTANLEARGRNHPADQGMYHQN